jgi:hypothetical protein
MREINKVLTIEEMLQESNGMKLFAIQDLINSLDSKLNDQDLVSDMFFSVRRLLKTEYKDTGIDV